MNIIYFAVRQAEIYNEKLGVFKTYFEANDGFRSAFLLALGIAAVCAIIYYIIARIKFSWPSLTTWLVTLVACGAISFFATGIQTGIHAKDGRLPQTLQTVWSKKSQSLTEQQKQDSKAKKTKIENEFSKDKSYFSSSPVNRLCWTNVCISIVFFYLFSIIINGFSIAGANTPHRGIFTKKN